jgi:hypothetical protein
MMQQTLLARERIESRIVFRWNDRIGEVIQPKPGEIEAITQAFDATNGAIST